MKKTFKMIGMVLMAIVMVSNFSSCSKDDEPGDGDDIENDGGNSGSDESVWDLTHDKDLLGTWFYSGTDEDGVTYTDQYTLKEDGTFENIFAAYVGENMIDELVESGLWQTFSEDGKNYVKFEIIISDGEELDEVKTYTYEFLSDKNIVKLDDLYYSKK